MQTSGFSGAALAAMPPGTGGPDSPIGPDGPDNMPSPATGLGPLLEEFAYDCAGYCDATWLPLPLVLLRAGNPLQTPLARRMLSAWLIREAGGDPEQPFQFIDTLQRSVLLPAPLLVRVTEVLGLLSLGQRLRHLLDRERVARVQALFGRDAYRLALQHADSFPEHNDIDSLLRQPDTLLRDAFRQSGFVALRKALMLHDDSLAARWLLKFDRAYTHAPPGVDRRVMLPAETQQVRLHLLRLIHSLDPAWHSLF